ncbi:hypothetical protein K2173_010162 (mitochondrion) [Erythroxylum novogranatense]|uniref:Uncharacterized protein n=1 Tax=Erythroxylum novogranatense TaxID=1862640 RepID=A0AAV8S448_9ROSI|nr:hypothetical protein K2173_010162 [Erythroxylum novogranatense]
MTLSFEQLLRQEPKNPAVEYREEAIRAKVFFRRILNLKTECPGNSPYNKKNIGVWAYNPKPKRGFPHSTYRLNELRQKEMSLISIKVKGMGLLLQKHKLALRLRRLEEKKRNPHPEKEPREKEIDFTPDTGTGKRAPSTEERIEGFEGYKEKTECKTEGVSQRMNPPSIEDSKA